MRWEQGGLRPIRLFHSACVRGISTSVAGQTSGAAAVGALTTGAGSAIPSLDPTVSFNYNWAHQTTPQSSSFTTGTTSLVNTVTTANTALQKSFLTGTDLNFGWNNTLDLSPKLRQPVKTHFAAKGENESWDCLAGSSHEISS